MRAVGISISSFERVVDRWRSPVWRLFYVVVVLVTVPLVVVGVALSPESWPYLAIIVSSFANITLNTFRVSLSERSGIRILLMATMYLGLAAAAWGFIAEVDLTGPELRPGSE